MEAARRAQTESSASPSRTEGVGLQASGAAQRVRGVLRGMDQLSMRSGLLWGVGVGGIAGAGLLWAGPGWGLSGAVVLLGTACALAQSGEPVAEPPLLVEPLDMLELAGGEFWMGSPESEPERNGDELRHRVRLSPFAMARVPVTQQFFLEVMAQNPSYFAGELLPVERVSWFDAIRFCNRLSEQVGLMPCYRITELASDPNVKPEVAWDSRANGYRLPTEAEWEYACRAGTQTAYSFGDDPALLDEHAWFMGNSERTTHAVGTKPANPWGLFELHGNVFEWCWDGYEEYQGTNPAETLVDPRGPMTAGRRVLRGGCFDDGPKGLRAADRFFSRPEARVGGFGFRCVRSSWGQRRGPGVRLR